MENQQSKVEDLRNNLKNPRYKQKKPGIVKAIDELIDGFVMKAPEEQVTLE